MYNPNHILPGYALLEFTIKNMLIRICIHNYVFLYQLLHFQITYRQDAFRLSNRIIIVSSGTLGIDRSFKTNWWHLYL